ncbi:MAG TPA: hypothetical protein VGL87_14130, partial [Steroidobacteraceae bacterium]
PGGSVTQALDMQAAAMTSVMRIDRVFVMFLFRLPRDVERLPSIGPAAGASRAARRVGSA